VIASLPAKVYGKDINTKRCGRCGIFKDVDDFNVNRRTLDGKEYLCKSCRSKYVKEQTRRKREDRLRIHNAILAKTYVVTIDDVFGWEGVKKPCSSCKVVKYLKDFKAGKNRCKECIKSRAPAYDPVSESQRYQRRKDKLKSYRNGHKKELSEYQTRRRRSNIQHRLSAILRTSMSNALNGRYKSSKTLVLLGCTMDQFKIHLQNKFTRGMSWENYGPYWHIDHIMPCSKFDLTKESEQRACFHFTNLQPLKVRDNLSKHAKILNPQMSLLL
jgi:hypothetical protein